MKMNKIINPQDLPNLADVSQWQECADMDAEALFDELQAIWDEHSQRIDQVLAANPVSLDFRYCQTFAIPEMSGNKMVWHVNYNHAEKEEVEFITDNLKNNTDSILLSYGLAFLSKDILSVLGVEYPVGVPSQYGSISNVNIKDCQFDVTFLWEHISDENIMNYEDQYED